LLLLGDVIETNCTGIMAWLWSFKGRDTKLERFLAKNQLKLPNFENWSNEELSKSTNI
jgi:hypothetical protein